MGSPLDDALEQFDQDLRRNAGAAANINRRRDEERREFEDLVTDFLDRMNRAGNPGAEEHKLFPLKRRFWQHQETIWYWSFFDLSDMEGAGSFHLAVDGRFAYGSIGMLQPDRWVDYRKMSGAPSGAKWIVRGMASEIRRHGLG